MSTYKCASKQSGLLNWKSWLYVSNLYIFRSDSKIITIILSVCNTVYIYCAKTHFPVLYKFTWTRFDAMQNVSSQQFVCYTVVYKFAQALLHIWNHFHHNQQQWSPVPSRTTPDTEGVCISLPYETKHSTEVSTRKTYGIFQHQQKYFIINMDNVTLTGVSYQQSSVIHGVSEFGIIVIKARNLTISSLHFSGCGTQIQEALTAVFGSSNLLRSAILLVSLRSATLFVFLVSNVSILHTHVYDSKGAGMLAVNTYDLTVYQTSFVCNVQNCFIWFSVDKAPAKLHVFPFTLLTQSLLMGTQTSCTMEVVSVCHSFRHHTPFMNIINVTLYNNTAISFGNFIMTILEGSSKYTMVCTENIRSSNHLRPTHSEFTVLQLISHNSISPHQGNHSQQFEYIL